MNIPSEVRLVEVGPRDGLQNEPEHTSVEFRVELIDRLSSCGLTTIEIGSFVSPKWVPQMADTDEVLRRIRRPKEVSFVALVPNEIGMNAALDTGIQEIAVFTAASETFSRRNTNCGIDDSFHRFEPVFKLAKENNIRVRGYISCVAGCPYEGEIKVEQVIPVLERLLVAGCYEVSLGDTIGVGTASTMRNLILAASSISPLESIAVHFHDTYGQALPNILVALECEVSVIDCSVGGLGGCPYAKGASGNVATEEVVYMLDGLGVRTGVNLEDLVDISGYVSESLGKSPISKVATTMLAKRKSN